MGPPRPSRDAEAPPLPRSFYARSTLTVARDLLGCVLARRLRGEVLRARIVETEGYVGEEDKACHARAGRTARTDPLYGPPGIAYVYLTYGMHYMLNAVTEQEGFPAAVLIRAAEPLEGIETMKRLRGLENVRLLAAGPARLTEALALDLTQNRADLSGPELWIEPGVSIPDGDVATSARVGCHTALPPWDAMPWRFYVAKSLYITPGKLRLAMSPDESRDGAATRPASPASEAPRERARKSRGGGRGRHRG